MDRTKVAIVGLGTVGSGVARLLLDYGDRTARHAGRRLWLEQVVVEDLEKPRGVTLPAGILSTDLKRITGNQEIVAVAHLVGGLEPARTIMLELLESGKDVVTANKALLAEHGPELFDRARELGRSIAFEASVAGGIPIIANISQCLSANQILVDPRHPQRHQQLHPHADGGAEAPITLRRAGRGPAAGLCRGRSDDGRRRQRRRAEAGDPGPPGLRRRASIGTTFPAAGSITLDAGRPAICQGTGLSDQAAWPSPNWRHDGLELHVSPTLVKIGTPLAEVRGAYNAISVVGDAVGPLFFHGLGPARCRPPRPWWPT